MTFYVDTSALVKLVVREPETAALRTWLSEPGRTTISSDLARTELMRAARRLDLGAERAARQVLESIELLALPADGFERAGLVAPAHVRSLDALHLAAALRIGDALEGIVTYDHRLGDAAQGLGIAVASPADAGGR